jgi:hypothetical protein
MQPSGWCADRPSAARPCQGTVGGRPARATMREAPERRRHARDRDAPRELRLPTGESHEAKHRSHPHHARRQPRAAGLPHRVPPPEGTRSTVRPRQLRQAGTRSGGGHRPKASRGGNRHPHRRRAGQGELLRLHRRAVQRLRAQAGGPGAGKQSSGDRPGVPGVPRLLRLVRAHRGMGGRSRGGPPVRHRYLYRADRLQGPRHGEGGHRDVQYHLSHSSSALAFRFNRGSRGGRLRPARCRGRGSSASSPGRP